MHGGDTVRNEDMALNIDAFPPPKIAEQAETVGVSKAGLDFWTLFVLAVLAGAFIALGAMFSTTVTAGAQSNVYFGVAGRQRST